MPLLEQLMNGVKSASESDDDGKVTKISLSGAVSSDDFDSPNDIDRLNEKTVLIIPIIGAMLKYGTWYSYGVDYAASLIAKAEQADNIVGTILLFNTPGGSTQSLIQIEKSLTNRKKPCIAVIDGQCCSCGIHVACLCDKIYAENEMCEVGSIGVFAQILDNRKAMEDFGFKLIEVYPPESSFKNKTVRDALDGDPQYLIDESLSPFARKFQEHVRTCRKQLDESVEGILEGRVFYAYDAVNNGLIDGITTLEEAVDEIYSKANEASVRESIISVFNN